MNIDVNIDSQTCKSKPPSGIIGIIGTRVSKNIENISLEEFINRVGDKGTAFTRAILKVEGKMKTFKNKDY